MKQIRFSPRRRDLMIATLAGAAAPAAFAGLPGAVAPASEPQRLVVSGRFVGPDGRAIAGAMVEAWGADSSAPAIATTDGDGRFVLATTAPAGPSGRPADLRYRVRRDGRAVREARLRFTRAPGVAIERIVPAQRDETGVWRAAFAATFA